MILVLEPDHTRQIALNESVREAREDIGFCNIFISTANEVSLPGSEPSDGV